MSDPKFSKNDFRYLESRVFESRTADGNASGSYMVRIQAYGERRKVNLNETRKRQAAKAAVELY